MSTGQYGQPPVTAPPTPPWQATTYALPSPRRRRPPRWIVMVTVITAIASVATFLTVLLWPGGGDSADDPLAFHGFLYRHEVPYDQPSRTTLTAMAGDHGFIGWEQGGDLHVVSFDVASGERRWRAKVSGAPQWSGVAAIPGLLVVLAYQADDATPRAMVMLDADSGVELWRRQVRAGDLLTRTEQAVVWLDRSEKTLRGLEPATGRERWSHPFQGGGQAELIDLQTPAGLALPTDQFGDSMPVLGDHRIILVHSNRTVQVIDGDGGAVLTEGSGIASPQTDLLLAYEDQLFVAPDEPGYQLHSYDLTNLSTPPDNHYTVPDPDRSPYQLAPCGAVDRICVLDTRWFDPESRQVAAVDLVNGGELWRNHAPDGEELLPVGDWLIVNQTVGLDPAVLAFDPHGKQVLNQPGVAVRLDDGNLLLFGEWLESILTRQRVVGITVPDGAEVDLGPPPELLTEFCSWNDRYLLCPGRAAAEVWQFAA